MSKKKTTATFLILAVLPSLLALVACNPLEDKSKSTTFIVVETLTGTDIAGKTVASSSSPTSLTLGRHHRRGLRDGHGPGQSPGPRPRPRSHRSTATSSWTATSSPTRGPTARTGRASTSPTRSRAR